MNPIKKREADQPKRVSKKVKQEKEEQKKSKVKWGDLPDQPFELILSYLPLEDLIKSRAVSRRWCNVINSFRPTSLGLSGCPSCFIHGKNRWVTREFAQNIISSTKFGQFLQTFGQSILANLKHLRLCKLKLNAMNTPSFVQTLNSFGQLEELGLFSIDWFFDEFEDFQLNLPMLKSVQLVELRAIEGLTLNAPRLQKVKHFASSKVELVHGESVEKLIIDRLDKMEVKKMKNLKYLYCGEDSKSIDSTLLSTLEHLNEIHLNNLRHVSTLFQQKAQYGRSNLRIFLHGCLLNGPSDPAIESYCHINRIGYLRHLAENPSKVAREILLYHELEYSTIEAVAPGLDIDLLKRFIDLEKIIVDEPVQDVERFLQLLQNLNIGSLDFNYRDQPPELFNRLPDHCAVQFLEIEKAPGDLDFLFRLKNLIRLDLSFSIDIELVRRVLEELPFLYYFDFEYLNKNFGIEIDHFGYGLKQFQVSLDDEEEAKKSDVKAVVQWIKRKARLV